MLTAIEVQNYRSFVKPARIELRPITILLGRNSAGKSSLTRLFPLLQESMGRATSAPVLWSSNIVDFGKISDVISRNNKSEGLRISFEANITNTRRLRRFSTEWDNDLAHEIELLQIKYSAHLCEADDGKTLFKGFTLWVGGDKLEVSIKDTQISDLYINGTKFKTDDYWKTAKVFTNRLFPYIFFEGRKDEDGPTDEVPYTGKQIAKCLANFIKSDASQKKISSTVGLLGLRSNQPIIPYIPRSVLGGFLKSRPNYIEGSIEDSTALNDLGDLLLITYFGQIIELANSDLSPTFESGAYLGPIRASGNRFYREQELSVEKIDEKGENLATYLNALNSSDLESFNNLIRDSFGIEVRPQSYTGHLSIEVGKPSENVYDNLADVGFGFSQLLPLVAQIHNSFRIRNRPMRTGAQQIMAVEQPELHLHPAFQANLAELFVAAVKTPEKRRGNSVSTVLLETHSEAMIGRFGELVSDGKVSKEDIAIYFIEKNDETGESTARLGEFDDDGIVENWPLGFFSARS